MDVFGVSLWDLLLFFLMGVSLLVGIWMFHYALVFQRPFVRIGMNGPPFITS